MDAERWQYIRELFRRTLEVEPGERSSFLDRECTGDAAARDQVELLIASLDESGDFLEQPAVAQRLSYEGARIGPYELVKRIGRGGMGMVYLALRADEEFQRRVAIKLLQPGEDSEEMIRRFRDERQILAALNHPNIAELLDGGTTPEGLPYLVMEYIEGQPIDEYCEAHGLDVEARLRLFLQVGSAVQFAHRNLVVHRDLKPANILVTADGVPKLLDFGIAKLLNPELSRRRERPTVTAQRLMTPEYASPELLRGEPVTTVSDVYSLGVLLYKLLTGQVPFETRGAAPAEMLRAVCEDEPQRPSAALRAIRSEATLGPSAKRRESLSGDLDNIVSMALRKEPWRRYASVEHFSDDLRRYLEGRAVVACGSSVRYRIRKFVSRHRFGVFAGAVVFVLAVSAAVIMTMLYFRVVEERNRAKELALRSQIQVEHTGKVRDRAEYVGQFLSQLLASLNSRGMDVRGLMREEVVELEERYRDQPLEHATWLQTVGVVYRQLGFYDEAESVLRRSLEQRRRLLGDRDLAVADSQNELAMVYKEASRFKEGEALAKEALEIRRELLGEDHLDVAESLNDYGFFLYDQGHYDKAEEMLLQALEITRTTLGDDYPDVLSQLSNLASLSYVQGNLAVTANRLRELLELARKRLDESHPELALYTERLATLLAKCGRYDEARIYMRSTLTMLRRSLQAEHPRISRALLQEALLEMDAGDFAAAERRLDEVLESQQRVLGEMHVDVAMTLRARGRLFFLTDRLSQAESAYRRAGEITRLLLEPDHPQLAADQAALAKIHAARGELEECERKASRAVQTLQALPLTAAHRRLAVAMGILGGCLAEIGRDEEAEGYLTESFVHIVKVPSTREVEGREILKHLQGLYRRQGRPEKLVEHQAMFDASRQSIADACTG